MRALRISTALGAGVVAWFGYVVLGMLCYLALLLFASLTGGDPGGPLAGPLIVALGAVAGLAGVVLAWVAVAVGVWSARRTARPGRATAVSGLVLVGLVVLVTWGLWVGGLAPGVSPLVVGGVLLVVVGPAWLAVSGADLVVVGCGALLRRRSPGHPRRAPRLTGRTARDVLE